MFYIFKCSSTHVAYIGVSAMSAGDAETIVAMLYENGDVDTVHLEDKIELWKKLDGPEEEDES